MIRHLFVWKAADPELNPDISTALTDLMATADDAVSWNVGQHVGDVGGRSWHGVLSCDFASSADLAAFMQSPSHIEVVSAIGPRLADVAIVDHEVTA